MGLNDFETISQAEHDRQVDMVASKRSVQELSLKALIGEQPRAIDIIEAIDGTDLIVSNLTAREIIERSLAKLAEGRGSGN